MKSFEIDIFFMGFNFFNDKSRFLSNIDIEARKFTDDITSNVGLH